MKRSSRTTGDTVHLNECEYITSPQVFSTGRGLIGGLAAQHACYTLYNNGVHSVGLSRVKYPTCKRHIQKVPIADMVINTRYTKIHSHQYRCVSLIDTDRLQLQVLHAPCTWARILVQVTINRRLWIGRDGHLDQSKAYDLS